MAITGTGLGSGLNINEIVGALVTAQRAPKTEQLDRLEARTDAKISGVGKLKSALEAFQSAMKELGNANAFSSLAASSSDESRVGITASNGAVGGSYQVKVNQLATASKVATGTVPSDTIFSAGSLTIRLGGDAGAVSYDVEVPEGASLLQVRDAINNQLKEQGITANLVSDPGDPEAGSRLVLSSSETGEGKDVFVSGSNGSLQSLDIDATQERVGNGAGYISQAKNAQFELDGLPLSSPTNTISSAVDGITISLLPDSQNETVTIAVGVNEDGLKESVQKFVDAYNQLIKVADDLTKVSLGSDGTTTSSGALVGDASLRQLLSSVRNELTGAGASGSIGMLSDLGITTQRDGSLGVDEAKLGDVLKKTPDAIGAFFTGSDGLFSRLDGQIKGYTQTGGVLAERSGSLQGTLDSITKQREAHERRMASVEARLFTQFNAMDSLVGRLTSTGNSLLASLEALTASKTK